MVKTHRYKIIKAFCITLYLFLLYLIIDLCIEVPNLI